MNKYTKEILVNQIKDFYKKHGRIPFENECRNRNGLAGHGTFARLFGSFNEAIRQSGFHIRFNEDHELLEELKKVVAEIGYIPTYWDIRRLKRNRKTFEFSAYQKRFGSFENALLLAGIKFNRPRYKLRRFVSKVYKALNFVNALLKEKV